jgi:predicted AAA+ superfamily ATPase
MLNLANIGRPLCKIDGGKYKNYVISFSEAFAEEEGEDKVLKEFKQLKIANDSKFQQIPDTTKAREIIYITGPSGSGKSTYTRKFLEQYKKKFKNNPIYLFSALPEDESLDDIKPKRIVLDETLISDPISVEDFSNCVVIFDDIDVISNKK